MRTILHITTLVLLLASGSGEAFAVETAAALPISAEPSGVPPGKEHEQPDSTRNVVEQFFSKQNPAVLHYYRRRQMLKDKRDSLRMRINEPFDTTRDDKYWLRALKHLKLDINDTTVKYPKFLNLCVKVYRWGDKAFNSYDPEYVVSVGKNWKVMLKNNNWIDTYTGHLTDERFHIAMNSNVSSNFGFQISFMAVSYSYMVDLDNILGGDKSMHHRWDFSFTCSRFSLEAHRSWNVGNVNIHRFGNYNEGKRISVDYDGLIRESKSLDLYYFLNHRRYSQAAAYCYSKKQIRSAGSFIAGLLFSKQEVIIDYENVASDMKSYLPRNGTEDVFFFNYNEFNVLLGYAYNWVFHRNWLFNITAAPSIGFKHSGELSVEGDKKLFSFNFRARMGIVRNAGNFFYAFQGAIDGHLYHSKQHSFFNSIIDFNITAGFRF